MSDYGIKPEWAQAWVFLETTRDPDNHDEGDKVADLALHLLAGWMESEFRREHKMYLTTDPIAPHLCCGMCGNRSNWEGLHAYDHGAWIEAARKVMEEMGK